MKTELRGYQKDALYAFLGAGKGTLKMFPGSGKSIIALAAIEKLGLGTLVLVPTIDLRNQWMDEFVEEGIENAVVMTYARAARYVSQGREEIFDAYPFIVADEAHHLAVGESYRQILIPMFKARYALGLTATPPTDPENVMLQVLPVVYERTFEQGRAEGYAAPFEVRKVPIQLTPEERAEYARLTEEIRVWFLRSKSFKSPLFTKRKQLVAMAGQKFEALVDLVASIMDQESPTRIFVWSEYVDALEEAKRVLDRLAELRSDRRISSMVVTGMTPKEERKRLLSVWGTEFRILLVAKIGEEGLDYPEVEDGIILAGAKTDRQNIQRVGRLLRPSPGKEKAKIWVIYATDTMEEKIVKLVEEIQ